VFKENVGLGNEIPAASIIQALPLSSSIVGIDML